MQGLKFIFGMDDNSGPPETQTEADVHLVLNVSTNELPDVRSYADSVRTAAAHLPHPESLQTASLPHPHTSPPAPHTPPSDDNLMDHTLL